MSLLMATLARARRGQSLYLGLGMLTKSFVSSDIHSIDIMGGKTFKKGQFTAGNLHPMVQRCQAFSTSSPRQVLKVHDIKELTDVLIGNYISESDSTSTGTKYLVKVLQQMKENPSTRMLTLSRLALKAPPDLKWFCSWLWPLMNGIKSPEDAFPISIDPDVFCTNEEKQLVCEDLWRCTNAVQAQINSAYGDNAPPLNSWAYKGEKQVSKTNTLESFHDHIPALFGKVPISVLRKICETLESLHRNEIDMVMYLKQMKKNTSFHSTELLPVLLHTGLSNEFLQQRYLQQCAKKQKTSVNHVVRAFEALFAQLSSERLEQELIKHKDAKTIYKEKQEKKHTERDDRKFGVNHALYVTLQVERIPYIDDYGAEGLKWKHVARRADTNMGVGIAQAASNSNSAGEHLYDVNEVKPPIIENLSDVGQGHMSNVSINLNEDNVHYAGEDMEFRTDSISSERKIFIENIPDSVDERDIALALRNCGDVKRVWLHRANAEEEGSAFGAVGTRHSFFKNEFKNETVAETYYSQVKKMAAARGPIREEKVFYHPVDPNVDSYAKDDRNIIVEEMSAAEAHAHLQADVAKGKGKAIYDDWKLLDDDADETGFVKLTLDRKGKGSEEGSAEAKRQKDEEISVDLSAIGDDDDRDDLSLMGDSEKTSLKYVVSRMLKEENSAASVKQNKKSAALKKRVARTKRNFNYAYVTLSDNEAYDRATRDEMRIFGMFLDGHSCRIQESARLRTLILEVQGPLTCEMVRSHLVGILGTWFSFELPRTKSTAYNVAYRVPPKQLMWSDVALKKPVFIHLEFSSHEEAWKGFEAIDQASQDGAPVSVSWVKSQLYWKVARKAKEMAFDSRSKQVGLEIQQVLQESASQ